MKTYLLPEPEADCPIHDPPITLVTVGQQLRQWRKRKRWGLRPLAKLLGTSASTLNRLEHGKNIRGDVLLAVINIITYKEL